MAKLTALFACVFLACLFGGAGPYHASDFWSALVQKQQPEVLDVLFSIRLPRVLLGVLVGALFAAGGTLCQGLFRNPLASPSVLGTESSATLAVCLLFFWFTPPLSTQELGVAALSGCMSGALLLLGLSSIFRRSGAGAHLLLSGFALNAFFAASTAMVISFLSEDPKIGFGMVSWIYGSLLGKGWSEVALGCAGLVVLSLLVSPLLRRLDLLSLGEDTAATLGVRVVKLEVLAVVFSCAFVSTAISIGGAMPFVGLVAPHLARLLVGSRLKPLFFASLMFGAILVLSADFLARTLRYPTEMEVGMMTSLLGAPFLVWMMIYYGRRGMNL